MKRLKRLALAVAVVGATLAPFAAARPAMAATSADTVPLMCSHVITEADNGKVIPIFLDTCDRLLLDSGLIWSQPVVDGTSVKVVPVPSPVANSQAWNIFAVGLGPSTITSTGRPNCLPNQPCPQFIVLFRVTINVILPPAG